jgi:hypothetical protein
VAMINIGNVEMNGEMNDDSNTGLLVLFENNK